MLAGYSWAGAWFIGLYAVAAPWRQLGGLENEFLRWLEWSVLPTGLILGFTVGRYARDRMEARLATHASTVRVLLYPPAVISAAALVALSFVEERGPVGVVATVFLAYWAGIDLAVGAVPLMEGRAYGFTRPLPDEPSTRRRTGRGGEAWPGLRERM